MAEPRRPRLAETLRGAIDAGLQTVQTRLELLTVELQEEKLRLSAVALNIVLCGLLLGFGLVFLLIFLTVLFWDSHRLLALGLATTVLLAVGVWAGTRAATRLRAGSRLFAASLAEIAQDRETLRPKQ